MALRRAEVHYGGNVDAMFEDDQKRRAAQKEAAERARAHVAAQTFGPAEHKVPDDKEEREQRDRAARQQRPSRCGAGDVVRAGT
jgi:hypothetical protein